LGIVSAIGLIIVGGFWSLYPYNLIDFDTNVFPVTNKTVKQGGVLSYQVDYCKHTKLGAEVSRSFIDGIIYSTPITNVNNNIGCHSNIVFVEVPENLPVGDYTLRIVFKYHINPIRTIELIKDTEQFSVVR
jgi:hypothetical protein